MTGEASETHRGHDLEKGLHPRVHGSQQEISLFDHPGRADLPHTLESRDTGLGQPTLPVLHCIQRLADVES